MLGWLKLAKHPAARYVATALVVSAAGLAGLQQHEGVIHKVYLDPVGIPTVCAGHTETVTRQDVGKAYSPAACDQLLRHDLRTAEAAVKRHLKVPVTQEQYDAVVSFTFNVGSGNLARSSFLRLANAGKCREAGDQLLRWNRARGQVLPGLTARRAYERGQWLSGCP